MFVFLDEFINSYGVYSLHWISISIFIDNVINKLYCQSIIIFNNKEIIMNIGGYQDFLNKFGKDNIPTVEPLKVCYDSVQKICNCQKQRKINKSEECNNIYINIINFTISNMVEYLKTKTTDSEIIFYHNGSHEIKRIKLR